MNTTAPSSFVASINLSFNSPNSGNLENAGLSKSLIAFSYVHPSAFRDFSKSSGSAFDLLSKFNALKIVGVLNPIDGFTKHIFVVNGSGGSTSSTISPLPVQYAAPVLKNTEISLPISPDHSSNSSSVATSPHSLFAAYNAVAAFPDPPPNPAPDGTVFFNSTQKYCFIPVFARNKFKALITKFDSSNGIDASSHTRVSFVSEELFAKDISSPKSMTWNNEAKSWYPSSLLRTIRRNKLILDGEKRSICAKPSGFCCIVDDEDDKEAIVVIFPRNPRPMLPRFSPPRLPIRC
mmetsp:Transcript_5716/g.18048  ORF Transcript_5716/g.18048 Transcript_5716/m.18048 type:complete len:292 (+) Transcript_5716:185-1060(+)